MKEHLRKGCCLLFGSLVFAVGVECSFADDTDRPLKPSEEGTNSIPFWRDANRWSFQGGIGFITGSTIDEIGMFDSELGSDEAGGEIYLLQVSYKLARPDPVLFGHPIKLDLELPLVFGVVNENHNDPFFQSSIGLTFRWKTFPWNRWLYTNLETGGGFIYSQHVLASERERHPDRERSHLEFYWPLQLMLAHPRHREHQLVLFLHHHSGGGLFHTGGANTLGAGYRFVPEERN